MELAPARNVEIEEYRNCFEFCEAFWECSKMEAILQAAFAILYLCGFGGLSFLQRPCLRRCVGESRRIDFYFLRCKKEKNRLVFLIIFGVENPVFRGPRVEPAPARNVEIEKCRKCF
ncbi:hypothetical protein CEXT_113621 [Caerostris extrusa]|uniref:Uncharacterized protein n=1 Tax=Caerostris extrusa TaxID=172846 RepID=A0AAV4Y8T3_CAEEX|nr:hypothetical protein CEXT_113621 [Caerostris extrusa]